MQDYRTKAVTILSEGKIKLTDDMAKRQGMKIQAADEKGVYFIVEPIQLKANVAFSYEGPVNPALLQTLDIIKPAKAAKKDSV